MGKLFSIAYWTYLGVTSIVLYLIALLIWLVTMPFDPRRRWLHRYTCWWATLYLRCMPGCRIVVEGREKIAADQTYVMVANHQSMTDIMALSALAVPFKWVSKKETFSLPFIGWNMYLNDYVKVDRGNVRNVRATLEKCKDWLKRGVSLMMFPEGTRSKTGEMAEFHNGSFKLAADCSCPVLPIVVDGTFPIYRGLNVLCCPGTITIRVLDPITVAEAGGSANQLCHLVHDRMQQTLAMMRGQASTARLEPQATVDKTSVA